MNYVGWSRMEFEQEIRRLRAVLEQANLERDEARGKWATRETVLVEALTREVFLRGRLAALEELVRDASAGCCMTCSWPLAKEPEDGCVPGNCSYRPSPECHDYQRVVARREALASVPKEASDE